MEQAITPDTLFCTGKQNLPAITLIPENRKIILGDTFMDHPGIGILRNGVIYLPHNGFRQWGTTENIILIGTVIA